MRPNITFHAIEQFIRRWEPNKSAEEAEEELDALLRTSKIVGKTRAGQSIAVSGHRPEVRLVIKERNVCVTVLPPGTLPFVLSEIEQELMAELTYSSSHKLEDLKVEIDNLRRYLTDVGERRKALDEKRQAIAEENRVLGQEKSELISKINLLEKELKELELWDLSSK